MNAGTNLTEIVARSPHRLVWVALGLLLITNLPLVLCMRLNSDAVHYDLQLRCLYEEGVLYRDILEPNFPGAVWIHMLVRAIGGWSSVALRAFDLLVVGGVVTMLAVRHGRSSLTSSWLALAICWFYLSLSTWSHCQRDTWMLLPVLGALWLRERSVGSNGGMLGTRRLVVAALAEGALWAVAFWIKPHVAIPALFVLTVTAIASRFSKRAWLGIGGVVAGGLLVGLLGSSWLIATGAWPFFWETQLEWNPEYLASRVDPNWLDRHAGILKSFLPWSWAHFAALPFAVVSLWTAMRWPTTSSRAVDCRTTLLCALYLGWSFQAIFLQHPFAYCHVPGVILALAVVATIRWPNHSLPATRTVAAAAFVVALVLSPCTRPQRLSAWAACVTQGPTLESRATFQARPSPYWTYYPELVRFLRSRGVSGRDLLIYNSPLIPLYTDLDLRPPTRYALTDVQRAFFPSRIPLIREAISDSPHRFIVSDLSCLGLDHEELAHIDPEIGLPRAVPKRLRRRFPFTQPVVFRSGWFVVHEAQDTEGL